MKTGYIFQTNNFFLLNCLCVGLKKKLQKLKITIIKTYISRSDIYYETKTNNFNLKSPTLSFFCWFFQQYIIKKSYLCPTCVLLLEVICYERR